MISMTDGYALFISTGNLYFERLQEKTVSDLLLQRYLFSDVSPLQDKYSDGQIKLWYPLLYYEILKRNGWL